MMKSIALLATLVVASSAFVQVQRPTRAFGLTLNAEAAWSPKDGKWEETNFEADLIKLETEAEKRLEEKIRELMFNIDKTGAGN